MMSVPQDLRNLDVTEKDRIRNEHARGSVKVAPVTKKINLLEDALRYSELTGTHLYSRVNRGINGENENAQSSKR